MEANDEQPKQEKDIVLNFVATGLPNVGKTSFNRRYAEGTYNEIHATIGIDFIRKVIKSRETARPLNVQIWDINHTDIKAYRALYCKLIGVFIMFDVTNRHSYEAGVAHALENIRNFAPNNVTKILVATKIDLADQRRVSHEEAKQMAEKLGIPYIETSAKDDVNIVEAVHILASLAEAALDGNQVANPPQPRTSADPNPSRWKCTIV